MERLIETALAPGRFVSYHANCSFVRELGTIEHQLAKLIPTAPAQAVAPYEQGYSYQVRLAHRA